MEFGKKLALFLLLSVCSVSSFPSRPLNDRPSELAWQAWLLVDSQNQLQNESDRRITPKSVFIAPKLGQRNDSLPDCAEGYRADDMGRCIKFVKVDEEAHLNFLLQKLNEMYAAQGSEEFDEEQEEQESMPTAGPLQVNIPLGQSDSADIVNLDSIAVVPAPTNGQFDDKVNVKRHPDTRGPEKEQSEKTESEKEQFEKEQPEKVKPDLEQVENPPVSETEYDYEDESTDEIDTTTQTEQTTMTDATTTEAIPTTMPTTEESTETTESIITTTMLPKDGDDDLKALFFRMPTNDAVPEKKNSTDSTNSVTQTLTNAVKIKEPAVTTKEEISIEPHSVIEDISAFIDPAKHHHKSSNLRFPDDTAVKFPEIVDSRPDQSQTSDIVDNVRDYYSNQGHHKSHSGELTTDQIEDLFRQYVHQPAAYVERRPASHDRVYNHRNRDRNEDLWKLTPSLRDEGIQKPLLLRFGRYPAPYYPQGLYNPKHLTPHHEVQYYGEETGQDYSNMYGRKRRRGNLR